MITLKKMTASGLQDCGAKRELCDPWKKWNQVTFSDKSNFEVTGKQSSC